jgi:hypothetical protein
VSVHASAFVRNFKGLTIAEKAVAFALASHANAGANLVWASMTTVAEEAGLKNRQTASEITARLVAKGVLTVHSTTKGGPRNTNTYRINCNSGTAVRADVTATQSRSNCNPKPPQLQPKSCLTATGELQEGFEGDLYEGNRREIESTTPYSPPTNESNRSVMKIADRVKIDCAGLEIPLTAKTEAIICKWAATTDEATILQALKLVMASVPPGERQPALYLRDNLDGKIGWVVADRERQKLNQQAMDSEIVKMQAETKERLALIDAEAREGQELEDYLREPTQASIAAIP